MRSRGDHKNNHFIAAGYLIIANGIFSRRRFFGMSFSLIMVFLEARGTLSVFTYSGDL